MAYLSMGEAHRRITDYLNRFSDAVSTQDGASLKHLLSLSSNSPALLSLADALNVFQDFSRLIKHSDNDSQFGEILVHLLRAFQSYRIGNFIDSYQAFEKSANAFIQEFRNWDTAWALPALYVIAYEIRVLAERVAYMYYTGRLEVFNENFPAADHKLSYALKHCNPQRETNIRMILKYLIPVKLSLGILPNDWLLEKYNLVEYRNVVQALKRGDLQLLRHALEEHEDRFLRSGVYLVLEKLELQVYQRLIKKIHFIQKQKDPVKAHQLKLEVIVKALKWLEIDTDVDEVECMVAILIYKYLVKGYFAHKSKVVVLSKQDPFPNLNGKPVNS